MLDSKGRKIWDELLGIHIALKQATKKISRSKFANHQYHETGELISQVRENLKKQYDPLLLESLHRSMAEESYKRVYRTKK